MFLFAGQPSFTATWDDGTLGKDWHEVNYGTNVFRYMPVSTDNVVGFAGLNTIQGKYAIITDGTDGSDWHTGVLESCWIKLDTKLGKTVTFFIGGGNHPVYPGQYFGIPAGKEALTMEEQTSTGFKVLLSATGSNADTFNQQYWDITKFNGRTVRFRIYDTSSGGWGHIAVDQLSAPASGCLGGLLGGRRGNCVCGRI